MLPLNCVFHPWHPGSFLPHTKYGLRWESCCVALLLTCFLKFLSRRFFVYIWLASVEGCGSSYNKEAAGGTSQCHSAPHPLMLTIVAIARYLAKEHFPKLTPLPCDSGITYLYTRKKFHWGEQEYTQFSSTVIIPSRPPNTKPLNYHWIGDHSNPSNPPGISCFWGLHLPCHAHTQPLLEPSWRHNR